MAGLKDLRILPKVRDSLSYLYVEHVRIDQEAKAIALHDQNGKVPIPCASLTTLMLGPGTTVTHAAIRALADNGCLVLWMGEEGVRFYAQGAGETRSAHNTMKQVHLWADPGRHLEIVKRMYRMRFAESLDDSLTLQQIRGHEGVRVRDAYAAASRATGVAWTGRSYRRDRWAAADPINRALSAANSCLYGVCHAAIVSAGYSPALGFIHRGKSLSFVYDIADLYKTEVTIPVAFSAVAESPDHVERRVRYRMRDTFRATRMLPRLIPDLESLFDLGDEPRRTAIPDEFDIDEALPGGLWDPENEEISGGVNYGDEEVEPEDGGGGAGTRAGEPTR